MDREEKSNDVTVRQKGPRSRASRQSGAALTQRPGRPAEAAFAVTLVPARHRFANIGTSRAGEKKATQAVLRHGASPELLPWMADQLWRANPLHRLLPISWGEITRALVTLAARSTADPVHAMTTAANLGLTMWREAAEIWIGTSASWWGLAPAPPAMPEGAEADRRFDAPDWEQHPFFRLLKQSYLTFSKQLLEEAERQAVDPDERQRLVFHLRQFIDAISPTSFLPTNPAAIRKAWETGGGSVADGLRNLLDDLRQGKLSMTDTAAFALGKNLATTPGQVVYPAGQA
jgi:Poly-beta-hydroxybutyrate polymerase (PhaC) N-terminus